MTALAHYVQFCEPFSCPTCGIAVSIPEHIRKRRQEVGGEYYCCNGHSMISSKTDVQKLKEQLAAVELERNGARARAEMAERSLDAYKGKVTEIKNRVGNGVCPCCKRTFKQLARHMSCKHPGYAKEGA